MIVDAENSTNEGERFAVCDKHRVVDFAGRWNDEPCDQQPAADNQEQPRGDELQCGAMFFDVDAHSDWILGWVLWCLLENSMSGVSLQCK